MKNNFKTGLVLASIAAVVMAASLVMAGPGEVAATKHNFAPGAGSGVYQSTQINEVCKFCHSPHNAGSTKLLWNKSNMIGVNAPIYRLYTSSDTLSNTVRTASIFTADSPSLLCLGCHDGKTAMNVLHSSNTGVDAGSDYAAGSKRIATAQGIPLSTDPITMPGWLPDMYGGYLPNMNIGGTEANPTKGDDLTNDHPIAFSYSDVLLEPAAAAKLYTVPQVGTNSSNRIRFFGPGKKVECTTCHDPHVKALQSENSPLWPFLVMSNSGSALCLSCHNK